MKRLDYRDESENNMALVQASLADPNVPVVLLFSFLLSLLCPVALLEKNNATSFFKEERTYGSPKRLLLLTGKLSI